LIHPEFFIYIFGQVIKEFYNHKRPDVEFGGYKVIEASRDEEKKIFDSANLMKLLTKNNPITFFS